MANDHYLREPHLRELVRNNLHDTRNLIYMEADETHCVIAEYTVHLLANRAWSMATRFGTPPECYAGLLSQKEGFADLAIQLLKAAWRTCTRTYIHLIGQCVSNLLALDL